MVVGGLWARLSAGFRENTYIHTNIYIYIYIYTYEIKESGQRVAGSGEVAIAVIEQE